jgi:hypothetical protein
MDSSHDPCQDFYQHSCGGFRKRYGHFANDTNVIGLMSKSSALLIQMILNQTTDPLAKSSVEKDIFYKTKHYYTSCLRKDIIQHKG